MIWEPFALALVLGLIVSAGLYLAYLWPSAEPPEPSEAPAASGDPPRPGGTSAEDGEHAAASPDHPAAAASVTP